MKENPETITKYFLDVVWNKNMLLKYLIAVKTMIC
jgi:hypothetical protein